jgi:VIT1/CCC1 family predicted Fe2+/Mn2+ transporter
VKSEFYNNWWEEKRSAYLYAIMSQHEKNILHKKLFADLKNAAEAQAGMWEKKITDLANEPVGTFKPDMRTRFVAWLVTILGTEKIHFILSAMKIRGMSVYAKYHSEHRHTSLGTASNLRAAVFGVNDGLISNVSLILGIAGANANPQFILLAGMAGLLAGACSMGAGEYISVRSQREVFEYQIAIEKQELEEYPEEEILELSLIYQARGIPKEEAEKLAKIMIENPETGLDTLAREELGLNPEDLVSPIGAMLFSFFSFAIGAAVPLLPFLLSASDWNLYFSIAATGVTLFLIGVLLSLFTNRNPILLGCRMLFVGTLAGGLTFMIGKVLGIAIG